MFKLFNITEEVRGYLIKGGIVLAALIVGGLLIWGNFKILDTKNEKISNLTNQLTTTQGQLTTMTGKYEAAKLELVKKTQSDVATEDAKQAVKQEEVKQVAAKTQANQYVDKKVAEIDAKYNQLPATQANTDKKRVETSLERAKGLWLTYCLQAPQDAACK